MMETPVNAPLKEKVRLEVIKLREMTFKEKLEHIWEYYKIYMVSIIIVIFIIFSLLNAWVFNPPLDTVLFISWNRGFVTDEQIDRLKDYLEERLIEEDAREEIIISPFFFVGDDATSVMADIQRTAAMLAAGMIDLFITDQELVESFSIVAYIQPLDYILAEIQSKNPEVYSRIEENILTAVFEFEEGIQEEKAAGIRISGSPLFERLGIFRQELYISLAVTAERTDTAIDALILFFE